MRKELFILAAICVVLFTANDVNAESNGDAPQEGQSWIINQDTHVWDEEVSVKDIVVNLGKTLKLENVSLVSEGFIEIRGETQWINSTIFHKQETNGDNISLYSKLTIKNSDLILDSIEVGGKQESNCLDLREGSILIITDFDSNPKTINDRSNIRSYVEDIELFTDKLNYTVDFGRLDGNSDLYGVSDLTVQIENSNFEFVRALRFGGLNSFIRNTSFELVNNITVKSDGFQFTNNSFINGFEGYDMYITGQNNIIRDNIFDNGTAGVHIVEGYQNQIVNNTFTNYHYKNDFQSYRGALTITQGDNHTIVDNYFNNISIHAMSLRSTDDNLINNNILNNTGQIWHNIMDRSGNRNYYSNNSFFGCGVNQPYWAHTCLVFWFWSFDTDDYYGGGHIIENNFFTNYKIAIRVNSFQNNNTITENEFDAGWHAIGLWAWPQGGIAPSGNLITKNTINNTEFPIALDYMEYSYVGTDNIVSSNYITNTLSRAITVWSFFKNFTIENNYIDNASIGIWVFDNSFGDISNGFIANNTLKNISYTGIAAYTSFGSAFTISNIHIDNNSIDSIGNGVFLRDVDEVYVANNTISTNLSYGTSDAGIIAYYTPGASILSNHLVSNIAIEIGGFQDASQPIQVIGNEIYASSQGVISNRTYSQISNNNITGFCDHDKCNIVFLQEVANIGIFSQEGEIEIKSNNISVFKDGINIVLADLEIVDNVVDFSEVGIAVNNSNGNIMGNKISNSTKGIVSFKSTLEFEENTIEDFEKAMYIFNSTVNLDNNVFTDGDFCLDLIDSDYGLTNNVFDCRDMDYLVSYNIRINIADEEGTGSAEHSFDIENNLGVTIVDSTTDSDGLSGYFLIDVLLKEADKDLINYNPMKIVYLNNDITVELFNNLSYNHTIIALLDTTSPKSTIIPSEGLINTNIINLEINLINDNNDFKEYIIQYLVNDEYAEWEIHGVFTDTSVQFIGEDGKEYRFRSLARDIYGNTESKTNYEYQVLVDTSVPATNLLNFADDYYFIGNTNIELFWENNADDVAYNIFEVAYSNFTNANLNPNSVTWSTLQVLNIYGDNSYLYEFDEIGHYGFTITSVDYAGNAEIKDDFDIIMNYASKVDTISFSDVPVKWGYDNIKIDIETDSLNLDYELFIAIQSIEEGNNILTWYLLPHDINENYVILQDLQDSTRYFLYAESRDLAGNVENPLGTTEFFSSNGQYDQIFELKYIPIINDLYLFNITIDNDLDGVFEKVLTRGLNKDKLLVNEYYLDVNNKTILFGGTSNGGFVPTEDIEGNRNIKVEYSGVHLFFEIYTDDPKKASGLLLSHNNITELVFNFDIPENAESCRVQMVADELPNNDAGWFTQYKIEPCSQGSYQWIHKNPQKDRDYFYRVVIEDEFGHTSFSDEETISMEEVVKLYSSSGSSESNQFGMREILPATIAVSLLGVLFGGILLYRSKNEDLEENVSIIESKPVAKYKVEELYLIYKDGRLLRNISAVEVKTDTDIMSGMLTAINDFVQDSFQTEGDLGSIDYGNNKIILQRGEHSYLAAVIYGEIDNKFKGKLINAVRTIERINQNLASWDGDGESIKQVKIYLDPIINETVAYTREMVDNYFSEKEIIISTTYETMNNDLFLNINISNYSSETIKNCRISPEFNNAILGLAGIDPDIFYSFSENSFTVGDVSSYNEIQFKLKMQIKTTSTTSIEIKMRYEQKGRDGVTKSRINIA